MNVINKLPRLRHISVFGKCLSAVFVVTALVAALMTFDTALILKDLATRDMQTLAEQSSTALAGEIGGAVKFGKTGIINSAFDALDERMGDKFVGGAVHNLQGAEILRSGKYTDAHAATAAELVAKVLETGQVTTDATGLMVAVPTPNGPKQEVVGVAIMQWSIAGVMAELRREEMKAAAVALALFLVMFGAAAWYLNMALRRPLGVLSAAVDGVARADYDTVIPMVTRNDEIGRMARSLDVMRDGLAVAQIDRSMRDADVARQQVVVQEVSLGLKRLAAGDLSQGMPDDFPQDYIQLKEDFDMAIERLGGVIRAVIDTAGQIGQGATGINRQSSDLSQRTENQAATLEETAAAMHEMTENVSRSAQSAGEVEKVVRAAQAEASQSGAVVQDAVAAMQDIAKFSQDISTIIGVIDDIAFQTNLLALNAGVEAARAGDMGKGFAVVASEVRALAQRSSEAAKEIKSLITDSAKQVKKGVVLVGEAGNVLQGIVSGVQNISTLISGIAASASAQSSGLKEINIGVSQLDEVTQQNAAMVQMASSASENLTNQARHLEDLVSGFRTVRSGKGAMKYDDWSKVA
jgi:methyl-accepting chemotaxis protein